MQPSSLSSRLLRSILFLALASFMSVLSSTTATASGPTFVTLHTFNEC